MIGIRINGGFLDLFPGTQLTFEFNNMALLAADSEDIIPTSYSFPVEIPLTTNNLSLIGYPHIPENADKLIKDEPCEIFNGNFLWHGKLTIRNARNNRARMYIIINPASDLQDYSLTEIDYGGDIDISSPSPTGHAKATTTNPLSQGYVFFPVHNPSFFEGSSDDPGTWTSKFQNYWDDTGQAFVDASDQQNAMPFVRVEEIFEKVFAHAGIPFINNWMTTDELRKLCVYNNRSIYQAGSWLDTINLANHVPDVPANEFVRKILQLFGIGLFNDPLDFSVTLEPMRDLIAREHQHDWTSKAGREIDLSSGDDPFGVFCHGTDDSDGNFELYTGPPLYVEDTVDSLGDVPNTGIPYYVRDENGYYAVVSASAVFTGKEFLPKDTGINTNKYINDYVPMFMAPYPLHDAGPSSGAIFHAPEIRTLGSHLDFDMNNAFSVRLMFYRGIVENHSSNDYPYANNTARLHGSVDWNNSLLWNEDNNIYDTWLALLAEMLNNQKVVTRDMSLHMRDIRNFKFQDKVRIGNMNYFVKKLRVSFRGSQTKSTATFVSTL